MNASHVAKMFAECPACQKTYPEHAVRRLGERDGAEIYHCSCKSCGHAMLALVFEQGGLLSSIGMMTDLEMSDALSFCKAIPLAQAECVEMHGILEKQSKALCQALLKTQV